MDAQVSPWDTDGVDQAVAVLKAVADPTRFRLLWALSGQELPVGRLAEMVGAHVAAVSQHLAKLRTAGLVTSRRDGTRIHYRVTGDHVRALLAEAVVVAGQDPTTPTGPGATPEPAAEPAAAPARAPWSRTRRAGTAPA